MNATEQLPDIPDTPWVLPEPIKQDIGAVILARHTLAVVTGNKQAQEMYESMPQGEPEF